MNEPTLINMGAAPVPTGETMPARAVLSAAVGSIIEGFDFIAYGTAAALVFNRQFFPTMDPASATLASFGAFATGLFARPLGAILFGHFGDRIGRRATLIASLFLMGGSTVAIGLIPNFETIGIASAILLVMLRILQGVALGGEMGSAVLMAVEHAPTGRAGLFGSLPQIGPPLGLLLSTGAFALLSKLPEADFQSWGWRIPFIGSLILIVLGTFIRRGVAESPAFHHSRPERKGNDVPLWQLLSRHKRGLMLAILAKLPEVTLYYVLTVFMLSYGSSRLGFSRTDVLEAVMIGAAVQIVSLPFFGWVADRVGIRNFYVVGSIIMAVCTVPLLRWIDTGTLFAIKCSMALALGVVYSLLFGPQSALFASQFPTAVRCTGISIGIQFAAAIGGGLAPIIATSLVARYHGLTPIGFYVASLAFAGACGARLMESGRSEREND
ncbi:MFS transporter [Paraburkholderia caribensis]|uniref:MFS transporter n=1 Tax=Paraburkholderia caribensis TaxID=75105 RepID=UPI0015927A1B|nr:MFS transporter [Paraburkholderia caribensis]